MIKKIIFTILTTLLLGVGSLVWWRDFIIPWGWNIFLAPVVPHAIRLQKMETQRLEDWKKWAFAIEGSMEKAPFQTKGMLHIWPLRVEPFHFRVHAFPLAALNKEVAREAGFVFTQGTTDGEAQGWLEIARVDLHARIVLHQFVVKKVERSLSMKVGLVNFLAGSRNPLSLKVHVTGNLLNPNIGWSGNIQNFLAPLKPPTGLIQKTFSPLKKLLPHKQ